MGIECSISVTVHTARFSLETRPSCFSAISTDCLTPRVSIRNHLLFRYSRNPRYIRTVTSPPPHDPLTNLPQIRIARVLQEENQEKEHRAIERREFLSHAPKFSTPIGAWQDKVEGVLNSARPARGIEDNKEYEGTRLWRGGPGELLVHRCARRLNAKTSTRGSS